MSEKPSKGPVTAEEKPAEEKCVEPAVHIFPEWCKSCGICVAFCPKQVLALGKDQKAYVAYPEKCIRCFLCAKRCPDFAITVNECRGKNSREKAGKNGSPTRKEGGGK